MGQRGVKQRAGQRREGSRRGQGSEGGEVICIDSDRRELEGERRKQRMRRKELTSRKDIGTGWEELMVGARGVGSNDSRSSQCCQRKGHSVVTLDPSSPAGASHGGHVCLQPSALHLRLMMSRQRGVSGREGLTPLAAPP